MVEVQSHGFTFEKWVRDTLFECYQGNYMQKWDVPPEENTHEAIPLNLHGLPVSIKSAKYGSPIGLGDVLRQRQINQPFLMIAGFWCQRSPGEKWFEAIGMAHFSLKNWSALWGKLTVDQLKLIDQVVKNQDEDHRVVRKKAREWKRTTPEVATSSITVNPKIDSKGQRRIQCSLPFNGFWRQVGHEPVRQDCPLLYGFAFPNPVKSAPRTFNQA